MGNPVRRSLAVAAFAAASLLSTAIAWASAPTLQVTEALRTIVARGDNGNAPFMVLDKVAGRLWIFDRRGRQLHTTPALVGAAIGDDSVPGIGERPIRQIRPHERTTPAGRFRMEPGRNLDGEDVFWVDYEAAVSVHRIRPSALAERRPQRLASATAVDNRISYGCINVPHAFFDDVIAPLFKNGRGWVYVLPETRPVSTLFAEETAQPDGPSVNQ